MIMAFYSPESARRSGQVGCLGRRWKSQEIVLNGETILRNKLSEWKNDSNEEDSNMCTLPGTGS